MIKFSFETPISYLKQANKVNDYHFVLAHIALNNIKYKQFFKRTNKLKILDNGCAELGKSIEPNKLLQVFKDLNADILILPDVWSNFKETIYKSNLFLTSLKKLINIEKTQFMCVLQGRNEKELKFCLYSFLTLFKKFKLNHKNIIIGLPYYTISNALKNKSPYKRRDDVTNTRIYFIQKYYQVLKQFRIHLLGAGFNFTQEISFMRHFTNIYSADTSTPYLLASQNIKLKYPGLYDRKILKSGTLNFYSKYNKTVAKLFIHNGNYIKNVAKF